MTGGQRFVVAASAGAGFLLAGVFSFLSWDRANQVAGIVSALVGVAALGVAIWAALETSTGSGDARVRVSRTGNATARGGGSANTGVIIPTSGAAGGVMQVDSTGDAESDGGQANTGLTSQ